MEITNSLRFQALLLFEEKLKFTVRLPSEPVYEIFRAKHTLVLSRTLLFPVTLSITKLSMHSIDFLPQSSMK